MARRSMQLKMNVSVFFIIVIERGKPIATQLRCSRDRRDHSQIAMFGFHPHMTSLLHYPLVRSYENICACKHSHLFSYGERFPLKLKIYKLRLCIFIPVYPEDHDHAKEREVYKPAKEFSAGQDIGKYIEIFFLQRAIYDLRYIL